jgi:hypothetical protein
MTDRRRRLARAAAVTLFCLGWGLTAVIVAVATAKHQLGSVDSGGAIQLALACATVGTVVVWHRPEHPMGWILSGIAVFFVLDGAGTGYATLDYRDHHGTLPLGPVAVLAGQSWAPAIVLFGLAFLMYPDGGALTSRWRWVIRAYAVLGCAWVAGAWALAVLAAARHDIQVNAGGSLTTGQNALWWSALSEVFFLGTGVTWLAWLGYQVVAWRRSDGERRQQLKWLITGAALIVAALFNVLRRRVQRVVDRRFNRARYDAEATVALFAARLKDTVDADSVTGDLAAVVQRALQPASLSVWRQELGQRSEPSSHLSVVTGVQAASLPSSRAGSSSVITSSR